MTYRYLFLDFETTGLDFRYLTILEVGWTVTDENLNQVTPLRTRFMAKSLCSSSPTVPSWERGAKNGWTSSVDEVVSKMHQDSKLHSEWLNCPEFMRWKSTEDMDRAIWDDLARAGWQPGDTTFLAGSGVSHFDRPVLEAMFSGLCGADSKTAPRLHYRTADTSSALSVLGMHGPKTPEDLVEWVPSEALELLTDPDTARLVGPTGIVLPEKIRQHRAVDDVAFGLIVARGLRSRVAGVVSAA